MPHVTDQSQAADNALGAVEGQRVTAAILVIGNEILSGRTKDQNIGAIAEKLTSLGIDLREVRIVADDEEAIVEALNALRAQVSYVFTTGGIGPTHDDITADAVAKAFGVGIDVDPHARSLMQAYYDSRGLELTPARLRMARVPAGARLILNEVSAAPGFMIGNVIVMAGVPSIMRVMLDDAVRHLRRGKRIESRSVLVLHPESEIAELLRDHAAHYPDVGMGSYPKTVDGRWMAELVLRSADDDRLGLATEGLKSKLSERGFHTA